MSHTVQRSDPADDDVLGTAMLDYVRGDAGTLRYVDGARTHDGMVRENYFTPREEWNDDTVDVLESVEGPVADVGCGAGQHSLWFQDHGVEVSAFDVSPNAVQCARERGVDDPFVLDMFEMTGFLPRDRFRTVLLNGTQLGLGGSIAGVRSLLTDLAYVTDEDGVAVVDEYDPTDLDPDLFGYRPDPREGVARRTFHFEYLPPENGDGGNGAAQDSAEAETTAGRLVGPTLSFVLLSPARLRDACVGTPWTVTDLWDRGGYYKARLEKETARE